MRSVLRSSNRSSRAAHRASIRITDYVRTQSRWNSERIFIEAKEQNVAIDFSSYLLGEIFHFQVGAFLKVTPRSKLLFAERF